MKFKKEIKSDTTSMHISTIKGAGVFLYNSVLHKCLMVQSYGNKWGPPKGYYDLEESDAECASRELMEETGISINPDVLSDFPKHTIYNRYIYFIDIHKHPRFESITNTKLTPVVSDEITGIQWMPLHWNTTHVYLLNAIGKEVVRKYIRDEK